MNVLIENFKNFPAFLPPPQKKKNLHFLNGQGFRPHPLPSLADMSAKNVSFFLITLQFMKHNFVFFLSWKQYDNRFKILVIYCFLITGYKSLPKFRAHVSWISVGNYEMAYT